MSTITVQIPSSPAKPDRQLIGTVPLWSRDDIVINVMASLLGCAPSSGLVNRMNAINTIGGFANAKTYGDYFRVLVEDLMSSAVEMGAGPAADESR
jgi:hypothetical protein